MRGRWTLLLAGLPSIALAQAAAPPPPAPTVPAQTPPAAPLDRTVLPIARAPFLGKVGPTYRDSRPYYAPPVTAPANAPNILLIMTDDVGFGAASTFGGPIPTPNLDRLRRGGCATRASTPPRCARRRAPRCSPGATITRSTAAW